MKYYKDSSLRPKAQKPRLLPGLIIVCLQWILWLVLPAIRPELFMIAVGGGTLLGGAFMLWWLFFSRLGKLERWGSLIPIILFTLLFLPLLDESIKTGNMGLMYFMFVIPNICLALMIAAILGESVAVLGKGASTLTRRVILLILIILAPGIMTLMRSDGLDGEGRAMLTWRWALTDEEKLLAAGEEGWKMASDAGLAAEETAAAETAAEETAAAETGAAETGAAETGAAETGAAETGAAVESSTAEWPGFRGPSRDGTLSAPLLKRDWKKEGPELLWKQPVGPGCSSFAIKGNQVYTQEQRGELELVTCYDIQSGGLIWKHENKARFYDSHAGAGPRATPTVDGDRVYTLGATGILNALDAASGELIWSLQAAEQEGMETLTWGFCASPLVVDSILIIGLNGTTVAYKKTNGMRLWKGEDGGKSYSSPQLFTIDGVPQILMMHEKGCVSMEAANGNVLWSYDWEVGDRILQPALTCKGELLLTREYDSFRCLGIKRKGKSWELEERWTNEEVKLNFNDHVIHKGHAYVIEGPYLSCIELETGSKLWRGKRYRGWTLLIPEQDLLLVLGEKGELALVEAKPDAFNELASMKAIDGRTWNHPAMADDIVVVRNSKEMAAYRLPTE